MNPTSWLSHLADLALPAALADAVLKSTLLLSLALLTVRATWRQSPALHSWLLGLALMSISVVFAQSFLRPGWRTDFALDLHAGAFEAAAGTSGSSEIPAAGLAEMHPAKPRFFDPSLCLFWLWAFGVGTCGVKVAAGVVVRWHHQRSLVEIRRGDLVETLEHARRAVGLRHRPRLFLAGGWAMPSTWGILRPAILLPRDASNWPPERLRHVLWHEMAHILRRDTLLIVPNSARARAALVSSARMDRPHADLQVPGERMRRSRPQVGSGHPGSLRHGFARHRAHSSLTAACRNVGDGPVLAGRGSPAPDPRLHGEPFPPDFRRAPCRYGRLAAPASRRQPARSPAKAPRPCPRFGVPHRASIRPSRAPRIPAARRSGSD